MKKKLFTVILSLILVFFFTTDGFSQAVNYQKTITIAPSLGFTSMDVQNDASATSKSVYLIVFDTLIKYDTVNGKYIPGLAESWKQLSDTLWQFKLRKGVSFHDGSPFTAEDVKFTVERGLTQSGAKGKFISIKAVKVIDSHTVNFELAAPDYDLVYKLCEPNTVIMSKKIFDAKGIEAANKIGTGSYMYKDWVQGDHVTLVRNEKFWGGVKKTPELIIRTIPEASSRLIALQTGEVDYCVDPPAVDLHYIAEDAKLVLWQIPSTNLRHIFLNMKVAPFDNILVRQATAHAINRENLIAMVYEGNATPAVNVMHPTSEYYVEVPYFEYDLQKAKKLLADAGYPKGFSTTIYSSSGTTQKAVASVIQAQLAEIGINVKIQSLETATFNMGVGHGGSYPIAVDGWGGHALGPDYALRSAFHSKGHINRSNIEDKNIDKLIDDALAMGNQEERTKKYAEVQRFIMNNANWLPLAVEQINIGIKKTLQGFEPPHGLSHRWDNLYIIRK